MVDSTKHFDISEFDCKCGCGLNLTPQLLVNMLEQLRVLCGYPLRITSGTRCQDHNIAVMGKRNSSHKNGSAADIHCVRSTNRFNILNNAMRLSFNRIGVADTFIHLDIDPTKPPEMLWPY